MKRKKNDAKSFYVFVSLVALVLVGLMVAMSVQQRSDSDAGPVNDRSKICMLQDTIRSGLKYIYKGKKYYLCCGGCLAGFQSDAATHSHATDPIDGKSVDKADAPAYAYRAHAYFFSSTANMTKFASDPEKFVANASSQDVAR